MLGFFFQHLEGLTEVFGRMSAGICGQKLPLWAEFPFLRKRGLARGGWRPMLPKREGVGDQCCPKCSKKTVLQNHGLLLIPKGPVRTKNTTTIVEIVNYYAVVFLLCPPNLVRRGPFFERKHFCNSQENGVRTRCAAIVNHPAVLKRLRVVNLLRVVFLVRRGPLGKGA